MGKWIRERMRRRRKKKAGESAETTAPQQPPLQPDFMTREVSPRATSERRASAELAPPEAESPTEEGQPAVEAEAPAESAESASSGQQPRRPGGRRRRRGRRGRGGRRTGAAAQGTPLQPAYSEPSPAAGGLEPSPVSRAEKAQAVPHAEKAAAAARRTKGTVVLAIGLPGSGKSTWFKRRGAVPLSSDVIRSMLFDDVTEQRFQDLVFSTLRSLLRARLVARMPVNYVDATNLSPHDRRGWIKMAHDFGYEVQAVFFDVPLEVCMERNARRNRVVPEDVMRRMGDKLRPPKFEEGFSKITVVRVKQAAEEPGGESELE